MQNLQESFADFVHLKEEDIVINQQPLIEEKMKQIDNTPIQILDLTNVKKLKKFKLINKNVQVSECQKEDIIEKSKKTKEELHLPKIIGATVPLAHYEEKPSSPPSVLTKDWNAARIFFTSATLVSVISFIGSIAAAIILSATGHINQVAAYASVITLGGLGLAGTIGFGGTEVGLKLHDHNVEKIHYNGNIPNKTFQDIILDLGKAPIIR
jgi:hypothetical protein